MYPFGRVFLFLSFFSPQKPTFHWRLHRHWALAAPITHHAITIAITIALAAISGWASGVISPEARGKRRCALRPLGRCPHKAQNPQQRTTTTQHNSNNNIISSSRQDCSMFNIYFLFCAPGGYGNIAYPDRDRDRPVCRMVDGMAYGAHSMGMGRCMAKKRLLAIIGSRFQVAPKRLCLSLLCL